MSADEPREQSTPPRAIGLDISERLWVRRRLRLTVHAIDAEMGGPIRRDILVAMLYDAADDLGAGKL